ncbi:unnamed protein product [Prunus armeniaca]|uniref:Uncharacterized protein n=1 Tax=Prunus armeniaca TaxID=36596 RepID=A0A6J5TER7_PRUAR|nr:unnamed protein product [Prunus armeniaca]CAB4292565.1 unnamed protein product [Prunus armeniaca]
MSTPYSPYEDEYGSMLKKAQEFIKNTQIREDCSENEKWYRQISKGGWPFSTQDQAWLVSDCSAEGLKVINAPCSKG